MNFTNPSFTSNCESNPALYKQCHIQWMDSWSKESMLKIPILVLAHLTSDASDDNIIGENLVQAFLHIHETSLKKVATPRKFMTFLHTYASVYNNKKNKICLRQKHLQAGISKLNEAKSVVAQLKSHADEQSKLLAEKRAEADNALKLITNSMQNASDQKIEMEALREQTMKENEKLAKRKKEIDEELKEIEPLIQQAKAAVGNIKSEALSEIRSLRAPPDIIRDILEAVLRLMGIFDTSWNSMKSFLSKRGVKEDICSFDAHRITPEIAESVRQLLHEHKDSFVSKNAERASAAAAPLAKWVKANVSYAQVLEKIRPLEMEQMKLQNNLSNAEDRMNQLSSDLDNVDRYVLNLRDKLNKFTKEAAEIEINLKNAENTISSAESLVGKLDGEFERWSNQIKDLSLELELLPKQALLASAFLTYLSLASEDERHESLANWTKAVGIETFDLRHFLSSEREQLQWKNEGLPSDELSMENALVILQTTLRPFLIDPSSRATEWLKTHLKDSRLEIINQQDNNFLTSLELAVRFGKTLIIQEVDSIEAVFYPLLRGDLISQGPRHVVQLGEKLIDYNEEFRLFLTTRNPHPEIPPDAASIITMVNFTTTRAGLKGQLLAITLQNERPDLEIRLTQLLRQEEDLKMQLMQLEDSLLEQLANASGNILENQELLTSLNKTKASSTTITSSLEESHHLQSSLEMERNAYLQLAEYGSKLYFVIGDMSKLNNMYQFSLAAFLNLFDKVFHIDKTEGNTEQRTEALQTTLQTLVYNYVCRSLFKSDQLMFALHLIHGMRPELFQENEWNAFTGMLISDLKIDSSDTNDFVPSWVDQERVLSVALLQNVFPALFDTLHLNSPDMWHPFAKGLQCEMEIPASVVRNVTFFQQLLIVQALRPDRLLSAMILFATRALGFKELSPSPLNLKKLYVNESRADEPILIITSPGADPSQELQELANDIVGAEKYHQVAMGQGQSETALQFLHKCSQNGEWLCLKNLHLVTVWLPVLEKELKSLNSHENFRLWITTEPDPKITAVLLQMCLKVTYEAPPGVKKNLQRTYDSWNREFVTKGGFTVRPQALFSLAWFHAVLQERRNYIPQGWTKFYEFSFADLRAGALIIDRICSKIDVSDDEWMFVRGLFEKAIYGGRVDNQFDMNIIISYLKQFFNSRVLGGSNRSKGLLGPNITLPSSSDFKSYVDLIHELPDKDDPNYFGLPANIERSAQRTISNHITNQLRVLMRSTEVATKFDREKWHAELSPILNLWKKLNQNSQLVRSQAKPPSIKPGKDMPVICFIHLERYNSVKLVQSVHLTLAALSKVIRGTLLLTPDIHKIATALLQQETPLSWQNLWEGPENPLHYLRNLMARALAIEKWVSKVDSGTYINDVLDLSELFHPDIFLHALHQQTARETKTTMDNLKFVCSWKNNIPNAKLSVQIGGLQLEGCLYVGTSLSESQPDSPSVTAVPPCTIAWIPKESPDLYQSKEVISLPVYCSSERERIITCLDMVCDGNHDQWIQSGAALFLKSY